MRNPFVFLALLMLHLLAVPQGNAAAEDWHERILHYEAEIRVNADSSVDVTENITFNVRNQSIRHGILRDIPIRHCRRIPVRVPLHVKEVRLDGVPEEFDVSNEGGFTRIKIGSSSRYVSQGEHVYTIRYSAPRQVRRFADHDELYWNVTGNFWTFNIDKVTATVILPEDIRRGDVTLEAYTGVYGAQGNDYSAEFRGNGRLVYESTRPFSTYEGMTIVATFPRGQVLLDSPQATLRWWVQDNGWWAGATLLLWAAFIFYMVLWFRVGRDPREGLILREETPLIGLSPASLRYIWKMGADSSILSAVMLQLAQKGWLVIEEIKDDEYEIVRTELRDGELLPEERIFLDQIFSGGKERFEIDKDNYSKISSALSAISKQLNREHHHVYFERNSSYLGRGFWFCFVGFLVYLFLGISGFYLPNYFVAVLVAVLLLIMMGIFAFLMPAYTALGRAVLDRIEGFRLAMSGGEDSLGGYVYADTVLTERYLAHATALDVNKQWGEQFSQAMERQGRTVESPHWYRPYGSNSYYHDNSFSYADFSSSMPRSFSRSVSSSATPPSSSGSGSSGGGFSGGGGGGGGGSGW